MPAGDLPLAAIADAGPLIHLDELNVLDILAGFTAVLVPSIVATETSRRRHGWRERAPACLHVEDPDPAAVQRLLARSSGAELDPGEVAALALWEDHRDAVLLCDDLAARRYAESLGCPIAGTLGLLLWATRSGRLDRERGRQLIAALPSRTTLYIRPSLVAEALRSLDD
ncbi:MAG: hypothetical protein GEU99_16695 [Luteitalea sp.]|nr:hypothetical protein [Luteitalea sp.]